MENVLVRGGAAYIGRHTCRALYQVGDQPVVFDNLVYGHDWEIKWEPLEVADTADIKAVKTIICRY